MSEEVKVEDSAAPVDTKDVDMDATAAPAAEGSASASAEKKPEVKKEEKPVVEFTEPLPVIEGKSEDAVQKLLAGAAKQINFYFSDANLPQDRYLFSLTCCNEPMYGWVPIETLISFSRMRDPYQGLGVPFVAYACRQQIAAEGSDALLGVSEDGKNVRRVKTMQRDAQGSWERSVYVKGFGDEDIKGAQDTQSKILAYFEQFGDINAVRMRREDKNEEKGNGRGRGKFKGSVFVEFAQIDDAKAFLEKERIPKYLSDGSDMLKMSKQAYVDMKTQERKDKGLPVDETRKKRDETNSGDKEGSKPSGNGGGVGNFNKGGKRFGGGPNEKFNAFRELEKIKKGLQANLAVIPDTVAIVGKAVAVSSDTLKRRRDDRDGAEEKPKKVQKTDPFEIDYNGVMLKCDRQTGKVLEPSRVPFEPKSALKFTGAGEKADWKDLKAQITDRGGISEPFLAAPPKEKGGRLAKKDNSSFTDEELQKLRDAKLTYGEVEVSWDFMTPSELQDFWALRASFQGGVVAKKMKEKEDAADDSRREQAASVNKRDIGKHHGGGGGRGGRGGRGGGGRGGGGRGGGRGGRGGHRDKEKKEGGGGGGMPPSLASGGGDN